MHGSVMRARSESAEQLQVPTWSELGLVDLFAWAKDPPAQKLPAFGATS